MRKKRITISLFYFLLTTTLLSVIGSLLPGLIISFQKSTTKNSLEAIYNENFKDIVFTLIESTSDLLLIFVVVIVGLSFFIEKLIKEIMEYEITRFGLKDPNIEEYNISFRYDTFSKILKSIEQEKLKELALQIGIDFGNTLLNKYTIQNPTELKKKWMLTDSKAGLIEDIKFMERDEPHISTIELHNTFIKRLEGNDHRNECIFLEKYVEGIIQTYLTKNNIQDKIQVILKQDTCNNCDNHKKCHLDITKSS